jgi:2-iminobutanoate/2-iminopropanoate deaminase
MTSAIDRRAPSLSDARPASVGRCHRAGGLVFTGTLAPTAADGALVAPGDCARQLLQAVANLRATLTEAGSALDRVTRVTYYVRDAAALPSWAQGPWYVDCWPSISVVELAALPEGVAVELEAVATAGETA